MPCLTPRFALNHMAAPRLRPRPSSRWPRLGMTASRSATTSPATPSSTARRRRAIRRAGRGGRRARSSRSTRCSASTTGRGARPRGGGARRLCPGLRRRGAGAGADQRRQPAAASGRLLRVALEGAEADPRARRLPGWSSRSASRSARCAEVARRSRRSTRSAARDAFRLVHDTFHHHLAGEAAIFPELTGLVHISGVDDPALRGRRHARRAPGAGDGRGPARQCRADPARCSPAATRVLLLRAVRGGGARRCATRRRRSRRSMELIARGPAARPRRERA